MVAQEFTVDLDKPLVFQVIFIMFYDTSFLYLLFTLIIRNIDLNEVSVTQFINIKAEDSCNFFSLLTDQIHGYISKLFPVCPKDKYLSLVISACSV